MPKNIDMMIVCITTTTTTITVAKLRKRSTLKKNVATFNNPPKEHTMTKLKPQPFVKEMLTNQAP